MDETIEKRRLFITADDRTGSLEIGGIIASEGNPVPVGPLADDLQCCVVDLVSRHISSEAAFIKVLEAHHVKLITVATRWTRDCVVTGLTRFTH